MSVDLRPYAAADLETLRALIASPSLAPEFDVFTPPGKLEETLGDSFFDRESSWIGSLNGEPAGFCLTFVMPRAAGGAWARMRLGVAEPFRRRGLGTALFEAAAGRLAARPVPGGLHELSLTAWLPNDGARAFAIRHSFRHRRSEWRAERPLLPTPPLEWPPEIRVRVFDGSEALLTDWNEVYNQSFAAHDHFIPSTIELCREMAAGSGFLTDGLLLAHRGDRCVGFCRNEQIGSTGVVGMLGVVPEARGIGLGRAMLRWALCFFAGKDVDRVGLLVAAANPTALALYRSEGFEVVRTREIWDRPFGPA